MEENMPQNCYELVWIFIIYAFIGWCTEVSYAALDRGIFVNRGFLNGPYCPIYGAGAILDILILGKITNPFILFFDFFCALIYQFICTHDNIRKHSRTTIRMGC